MIIVKWKWIHENKISSTKNTYKNILGEITNPKYKYINIVGANWFQMYYSPGKGWAYGPIPSLRIRTYPMTIS